MPGRTDSVERTGSGEGKMAQTLSRLMPEMSCFITTSSARTMVQEIRTMPATISFIAKSIRGTVM